jgi:hypothetical protein
MACRSGELASPVGRMLKMDITTLSYSLSKDNDRDLTSKRQLESLSIRREGHMLYDISLLHEKFGQRIPEKRETVIWS